MPLRRCAFAVGSFGTMKSAIPLQQRTFAVRGLKSVLGQQQQTSDYYPEFSLADEKAIFCILRMFESLH
jgi:hypothetical protein